MNESNRRPSAFGGLASFVNGLTWMGQPPNRPRDKWDSDPRAPARWEVPLALGVTLSLILVGVLVAGLAFAWGAAWLGGLAGLFLSAIVLQPLFALLRRIVG